LLSGAPNVEMDVQFFVYKVSNSVSDNKDQK
jgi:hypothetical protein